MAESPRLSIPPAAPPEVLSVERVLEELHTRMAPVKYSRQWALLNVAPDKKQKIGQFVFWRRPDFEAWFARLAAGSLRPEELGRRSRKRA